MGNAQKNDIAGLRAIGARIQAIRGNRSHTQCARDWGIERQYIDNYESGRVMPGGKVLRQIAERDGVNLNWLLLGEGPVYRRAGRGVELHSQDRVIEAPSGDSLFRVADAPEIQYNAEVGYEIWMVRELWQRGIKTPEQLNALLEAYDALAKAVNKKEGGPDDH